MDMLHYLQVQDAEEILIFIVQINYSDHVAMGMNTCATYFRGNTTYHNS
jgi:hypothetical protein